MAGIVKLDDLGLALHRTVGESGAAARRRWLGATILRVAPYLMRALSVAGTAAMFLVGGSIIAHGVPPIEHFGAELGAVAGVLLSAFVGVASGGLAVAAVAVVRRFKS